MVCTQRPQLAELGGAVDTRHLRPGGFCDLYRKGSNTAPSPVDENPLSRSNLPHVAQTLERQDSGLRNRRRLSKVQRGWLRSQRRRRHTNVFRKSTPAMSGQITEDLITRLQLDHILADRLDPAGDVGTKNLVEWFPPRPGPGPTRRACQQIPVPRVDRRCADPDQHPIILKRGRVDLAEFEHLGPTVSVVDDRSH